MSNKSVSARFFITYGQQHDVEGCAPLFAEDAVIHFNNMPTPLNFAGYKQTGYAFKGSLRYRFADHEEVYRAGDAYYTPPGHLTVLEAGCEYIEFSPAGPYAQTMEVIARNMQALAPGQA